MRLERFVKDWLRKCKVKRELRKCKVSKPDIWGKKCSSCKHNEICERLEESKVRWVEVCPYEVGGSMDYIYPICYSCLARHKCGKFKELS